MIVRTMKYSEDSEGSKIVRARTYSEDSVGYDITRKILCAMSYSG